MLPDLQRGHPERRPLKVAIVSAYRAVVPHYETELDIAQQHLDAGDQVTFLECHGELANCEFNITRDPDVCQNCRGRRSMGRSLLSRSVTSLAFDHSPLVRLDGQLKLPTDIDLPTRFDSVESLISCVVDGFDIGYAALSSLVSFCRDPDPDLEHHQDTLQQFIFSAWQTYTQTIDFLSKHSFDRVYVYNGRFAAMRSTLRACQKLGIDCYLHERGCDGEHFELLKNHLPHDLEKIENAILTGWDLALETMDQAQRQKIASQWFLERYERVEKVWHSFTKNQQRDRLPTDWNPNQKNISIFCSSDDEFVAIGDAWKNDLYPNQVDAIEQIVIDMLRIQPESMIYLRMHPNLKEVDNTRVRRMKAMTSPNLFVIEPGDAVDTYRLIQDSDCVVSFGSSVGAEAVYWGTPSVLLGPCFYQNLGGIYRSRSHEQTLSLLSDTLKTTDKTGMLKYGFWFQTRGYRHEYFQATGLFDGQFKGETVYAKPAAQPRGLKRLFSKVTRHLGANR